MPSADWTAPTATGPVDARVVLPGSKSLTNRYLVLAALASDVSLLRSPLRSRDTLLMVQALRTLGAVVDDVDDGDWLVTPGRLVGGGTVDCGLAGNVMRFVPAVAGLADGPVRFDGDPHARLRPMAPVLGALRTLGVEVDDDGRGGLPFTVARPRVGARRGGHPRRVGVVAVRVRAAAVRRPLRRGRHGAPRRQGGAEPAAHRDDRRDAARRRASWSTTATSTPGGSSRARSTPSTCRSSPTCPTPHSSSPRPWSPTAGSRCRGGRSTPPRAATSSATCST